MPNDVLTDAIDKLASGGALVRDEAAGVLREVMEGRTTFVVAHRLSTISLADEIVVMDGGRVVDRGSHEELLERCEEETGLPAPKRPVWI